MGEFLWFMHVLVYCFTETLSIGFEAIGRSGRENIVVIGVAGTGTMFCIVMLIKLLGRLLVNAVGIIVLVIATEIVYHIVVGG